MNTPAAVAAMIVFIVVAVLFGHPVPAGSADQPPGTGQVQALDR